MPIFHKFSKNHINKKGGSHDEMRDINKILILMETSFIREIKEL